MSLLGKNVQTVTLSLLSLESYRGTPMKSLCPHCLHYGPWRYIGGGEENGRKWELYQCRTCGYRRTVWVS